MKPLSGIKVLDLTRVLAGPYCTMLLQDLGAEVLKVEVPEVGDDSRHFGPFKNGRSLYFVSINRGKRSMTLNLKTAAGKEILRRLIAEHDIVVENFRPGVMEKLGFGYEEIAKINPRMIYAASSGFGHTGPDSQKPAYDILAQAAGGLMSITGWPDSPPTRVGCSIGDIGAALFATIGILAALHQRNLTGLGQKVDVAMLDSQVAMLENALVRYQVDGTPPHPIGNRHPTITPFQAYKTRDDYMVVAIGNDALWNKLCIAMQRTDLLEDERFSTNQKRTANIHQLNPVLEAIFAERDAEHWEVILEEAAIPHSRINTVDKVMELPQVVARHMIATVEDPVAGTVKIAGNPIKMSGLEDSTVRGAVPELGQHTAEVLHGLGYSDEEIRKLSAEEVI